MRGVDSLGSQIRRCPLTSALAAADPEALARGRGGRRGPQGRSLRPEGSQRGWGSWGGAASQQVDMGSEVSSPLVSGAKPGPLLILVWFEDPVLCFPNSDKPSWSGGGKRSPFRSLPMDPPLPNRC